MLEKRLKKRMLPVWCVVALALALGTAPAMAETEALAGPAPESEAAEAAVEVSAKAIAAPFWSYAVKFVCGFNQSNLTTDSSGITGGEATVKLGNYATDINIFNPNLQDAEVHKKLVWVVKEGNPDGREPRHTTDVIEDFIPLPVCSATMDDCGRIGELLYGPGGVPTPMPLWIGFLVIQSPVELDVTAVYTAEICSDWQFAPAGGEPMCVNAGGNPSFGAGISIDVEQVQGRFIQ